MSIALELADAVDQPQIARVAAMSDPVQRNLWITHIYHRLEVALGARLGGADLTWCAYGTWASKTAGRFIRGELVDGLLRAPARLRGVIRRIDARVRERIAHGNRVVFAELAPRFCMLVEVLGRPRSERAGAGAALLKGLAPGRSEAGGQDMLRRALQAYLEAAELTCPKAKAERILLANTLVGYHEQIRLQPAIAGALAAPVEVLMPAEDAPLRRRVGERLGEALRALMTRWLMTIALPGGDLPLGRDVPRASESGMFPATLRVLELPELRAVVSEVDRTPDTTEGSAADDWGALADRMNFIVDLFRSRQRDLELRRAPFSREQVVDLLAGARPRGRL